MNPFGRRARSFAPTEAQIEIGILLFWTTWFSIVAGTNVFDGLRALGVLPEDFPLASGNYGAIVNVTKKYRVPRWADKLFLFGATVWESAVAALFWRAAQERLAGRAGKRQSDTAFTAALSLFATFILSDEVLHAFKVEGDHRGIALLLLSSMCAMRCSSDYRAREG